MNSWRVRHSWHGFTSAQLETWRLCRGVNKSSFCKSEHVKAFMQHVSGESQVLWRALSCHSSFKKNILYFTNTKIFGIMLHEIILSYWWVKLCFKVNIPLPCFGCIPVKNAFWSIHHLADGSFLYNFNLYPFICSICRGACMSSSCSITMQPVGCVFSSWPSLRPSASPGSTVRQTLIFFAESHKSG